MKRDKMIDALLASIDSEFDTIEELNTQCIPNGELSYEIKIKIIDYLHHNKIILDYLAQEIAVFCSKMPKKIYFPIAKECIDQTQFESNLDNWFPGLEANNKPLYDCLVDVQHWNGNEYLPNVNEIINTYKHVDDVNSEISEFDRRIISFKDSYLKVGERGVKFIRLNAEDAVLQLRASDGDTAKITGIQTINGKTNELVNADPRIVIKKEKWDDFKFEASEHSIIGLLDVTRINVKRIHKRVKEIIDG